MQLKYEGISTIIQAVIITIFLCIMAMWMHPLGFALCEKLLEKMIV